MYVPWRRPISTLTLLFIMVCCIGGFWYSTSTAGITAVAQKNVTKAIKKVITDFTSGLHFTGAPDSVIRIQGKQQSGTNATIAIPASSGDYTVTAQNELSPQRIDAILRYYGSPATGEGQDIYDLGNQYGLDDAYFLADYMKESSLGRSVLASYPYFNPTGIECSDLAEGCTGADGNGRNWGTWSSRRNGYEAWFRLISDRYVTGKIDGGYRLTTIWLIACGPNGTGMYDGGSGCNSYAADVEGMINQWRAGGM